MAEDQARHGPREREVGRDLHVDQEEIERGADDDSRHDQRRQQGSVESLAQRQRRADEGEARGNAHQQAAEHREQRYLEAGHEPIGELRLAPKCREPAQRVALRREGEDLVLEEAKPADEEDRQQHHRE